MVFYGEFRTQWIFEWISTAKGQIGAERNTKMKVVDLSDWNDQVNWNHLKENHGVEGVIVKISEGRTLSELYAKHIASAVANGLPWGVYCYTHAQTTERAKEEAEVVMEALKSLGFGKPSLDIWFDVEDGDVLSLDAGAITANCSAFITACNSKDYSAGLYASLYTFIDCISVSALADYVPYWCAQYDRQCDFLSHYPKNRLQAWQYTDHYEIDGNFYDMNEWY
jgi:lysozyme